MGPPKAGLAKTTQSWRCRRRRSFANCCGSARAAAGPLQHSLLRLCRRFRPARNLPRKTRLRTFTGKKTRIAWADPATVIGRESTGRNGAVNVGVQKQVLSPGVQDADHADLGAQVFAIDGDLEQGLSAGGEQQVVEQTRVFQGQHVEFVGYSEHNMEVAGGQEFAFASRQPALARLRLALGAVPISARVV